MAVPETTVRRAAGLKCPQCSQLVAVAEGQRIIRCEFCNTRSLVQGDRGVRRWQVLREVDRETARQAVIGFFSGFKKAPKLASQAQIEELFLVYLPFWHAKAFVSGWTFGRRKSGKDSTSPAEVQFENDLFWTDAAVDVSEFGVHQVPVMGQTLEPYDSERLHAEGLVFEPSESRSAAITEAEQLYAHEGRAKNLTRRYQARFHFLKQRLSIVYYPLWVARYTFKKRRYQVVIDGKQGKVLYGKAPGNILYRALALVGGMALGNFILVNGTLLMAAAAGSGDDADGFALVLLPIVGGIGLIVAAYRAFRYGEEVEETDKSARKNVTETKDARAMLKSGMQMLEKFAE